ncbi:MAG: 50S ribosomal protein L18 [bacterium]|nr:50S ribosomal protein L18 [bacterium]
MTISHNNKRIHRKRRIRARISGTAQRPRLAVFRSLQAIYAQLIDDEKGSTMASAREKELSATDLKKTKTERATHVGMLIAKKAAEKSIKSVVFDRGGYQYHGRVAALADGAREGGLEF